MLNYSLHYIYLYHGQRLLYNILDCILYKILSALATPGELMEVQEESGICEQK